MFDWIFYSYVHTNTAYLKNKGLPHIFFQNTFEGRAKSFGLPILSISAKRWKATISKYSNIDLRSSIEIEAGMATTFSSELLHSPPRILRFSSTTIKFGANLKVALMSATNQSTLFVFFLCLARMQIYLQSEPKIK